MDTPDSCAATPFVAPSVWGIIFAFLKGYAPVLREVCRAWRDQVSLHKVGAMSLRTLGLLGHGNLVDWVRTLRELTPGKLCGVLLGAARGGAIELFQQCWSWSEGGAAFLAIEQPPPGQPMKPRYRVIEKAMASAAKGGNVEIMELCRSLGASDFPNAMRAAVSYHQERILPLFKAWGATGSMFLKPLKAATDAGNTETMRLCRSLGAPVVADDLLVRAAEQGRVSAMHLCISWGADNTDKAMRAAARGGRPKAFHLCISWGATAFNQALNIAAYHGHLNIMMECKLRGATDFDRAMFRAAMAGQVAAMRLCKEWGATNINKALCSAASQGEISAMQICVSWGATWFNSALISAAIQGNLEAMHLCREWGAADVNRALIGAAGHGHVEAMQLCHTWGARGFNGALVAAARKGDIAVMRLCRTWGASGAVALNAAMIAAANRNRIESMLLCKEWGATSFRDALESAMDCTNIHPRRAAHEAIELCTRWLEEDYRESAQELPGSDAFTN